jgi:hypothetical protein
MKEENKQIYNQNMSLEELTNEANRIIDYLEKCENNETETDTYQNLIKLNNLIEKNSIVIQKILILKQKKDNRDIRKKECKII